MTPLFIALFLFDAGIQIPKRIHVILAAFETAFVAVKVVKLSVLLAVIVAEKELFILKKNNELIKIDLKNIFRDSLILFIIRAYFEP